ncbi:MAG: glutathione S-transferase family protein [Dyella sp.]
MHTIYGMRRSGNCYKLQLLLDQLGQPYRWIEIDTRRGETRTAEYLARNPNGKVPLLERPDGSYLAESNAILYYLAEGTRFWPADAWLRAQTLQWLFFEQYSHEPYIAVARNVQQRPDHPRRGELADLQAAGYKALSVMEQRLAEHEWLVGLRYGIADIALYAYTHCAADGGFELSTYPALVDWLQRVRAQVGHTPMQV